VNTRAVANEFAKMRHLKVGLVGAFMIVPIAGLSLFAVVTSPDFAPSSPDAWNALLAGMSLGVPMLSPLLLAVLASRQTDIEHTSNGWLVQSASGLTPGGVCRAKLVALGAVVTTTTLSTSLLVLFSGTLMGIAGAPPIGHWAGFTACVLVINLTILALHILLSAKVENQLVALGIGAFGGIVAVFSQGLPAAAAHATPWGYYALAQAAGYEGAEIQPSSLSYPSIAALGILVGALFSFLTYRFDRQEA
jgi:hypothetical protein